MKRILLTTVVVFILGLTTIKAQFTVTSSTNATQMAQLLAGSGVTITNATVNSAQGTANGAGTFTNGNLTGLGFNSGVVLMTGDVTEVDSPSTHFISHNGNNLSDPQLDALSPTAAASHDRAVLEFDVVPIGDTLRFRYVFASEEYPNWVCSNYSDVFGFFVTGQNPAGGNYTNRNIALVPGTNLVVSINTINPGVPGNSAGFPGNCGAAGQSLAYSSLYVDHQNSNNPPVFDGHTVVLTAEIVVVPCQTYHLKLAIADVFDQGFDSGVFLEAGSITSTNIEIRPETAYGNSFQNSIEGCVNAQFKFVINPPLAVPYAINYTIGGTATNGVDYPNVGTSVIIPAGDSVATVNIAPTIDGIGEGTETVKIYLINPCTNLPYDSAVIYIQDSIFADATADRYFICTGEQANLIGLGGLTYQWAPTGSLATPTAQTTIASPTVTTTYSMTATIGGCIGRDTVTIHVSNANFTVDAGPNQSVCANQSVQMQPVITQGAAPYSYQWAPTTYMAPGGSTQLNPVVTPLQTTTYRVTVSSANGCNLTDSVTITVAGVGPPVSATVTPLVICPGQQVQLDFTSDPQACGVNSIPGCAGTPKVDTIKSGYAVQTGNPFNNVTFYGNYYKSTRMQMIYSAAELQAILGGGGTISQLAWQIGIFNSNATLENFTISLKCVPPTQTTLTNWETGMKRVFGPKLFTPAVPPTSNGWNNHSLDSLYDWDGVSSLVVEVCFYNPSTSSNLANMMIYSNVPNSVLYSRGNVDQCGGGTAPTQFAQRFNMRVRICQANYAAYNITWTPSTGPNTVSNPAIKNPTANPTTTQTYQVSVSYNGCVGSDFVTVSIDTSVKVNAGPDVSFCSGQQVQLTATSSGSPLAGQSFSYQWRQLPANNVLSNTSTVNVTPTGITSYVVQMNGGPCPVYDTIRVAVGVLGINHVITPITCNGANDGKIDLNPSGTAPYNYQWSANAATGNIDSAVNLAPGTYYATVTDGQNCVGRDTITLTQPTAVSFTSSVKNVSCNAGNDGHIALDPAGGTGIYTFSWSNSAPSNDTAYNLTAGPYTVTVYDENNCSASSSLTVNQPTALTFNPAQTKDIRCFNGNDGFITVAPTGGTQPYIYAWSHNLQLNQPTATGLIAGPYTVSVTDANGCQATENHTLTQPANGLTIGSTGFVDATCYQYADGEATVTPAGGVTPYAYLWSANANNQTTPTATGLTAGTYTVTVSDDSLCTATATVTVSEPQQITISEAIQNVGCNGDTTGDILLTVTPASSPSNVYSYSWSDSFTGTDLTGGAHNTGLSAGSYSVTVTNQANCTAVGGPYVVQQPAALVLATATIQNVSCFGGNNGSITANPTGGTLPYGYSWSNGSTSQTTSGLIAGSYDVEVTDGNGCSITDTYNVTEPAAPLSFGAPVIEHVLCNGASTGSIAVSVNGGTLSYSYSWSHNNSLNSPTASAIPAGNYVVTVTDGNNCTLSSNHTITQPAAIIFGTSTVTDVSCYGGNDGAAQVSPSGGVGTFTYTWNGTPGTNPQTGLIATTYTVVVTDSNNCTASTTVVVSQPVALLLNPVVQNATCYLATNGSIDAVPSGGNTPFTFNWSNGQTTQQATALAAGTYLVTVTDATGCSFDTFATVLEPTELLFQLWPTQVSCPGDADGTIEIDATGATPPYNYSATQDGANFFFTTDTVIRDLEPGSYIVIVSDNNGCTKVDTAIVPDAVHDDYVISVDSTSCFGAEYKDGAIHIEGTTAVNMPYQYSLDGGPKQYSGDFFFVGAGEHVIVLTNNWGCTLTVDTVVPEPVDAYVDVFPGDTTLQVGESIQLSSTFGPYATSTINSYHWSPSTGLSCIDCPNPYAFPYGRLTEYVLTITYNDHCVTTAGMKILVENNLEVYIPNAFTPNGDGNNDVFQIYGQGIKTIDLDIFNRWGEKVYEESNQFAGWDGTYKSVLQNPGVYVYNVRITFLDNRRIEKTGSVSIIR